MFFSGGGGAVFFQQLKTRIVKAFIFCNRKKFFFYNCYKVIRLFNFSFINEVYI